MFATTEGPMTHFSRLRSFRFAVALAAVMLARRAHAQEPASNTPSRFSLAAGIGGGSLTQGCGFPACPVALPSERTWMVRLGYRENQGSIGLEYDRWNRTRTVNGTKYSVTYTWIGPSVQWYPFTTSRLRGLHVQGLLARATFDANPSPHGVHSLGYGGEIAFDVPIIHGLVLTPYGKILGADRGEKSVPTIGRDGRVTTTKIWYSAVMRSLGIAVRLDGVP